MSRSWFNFFSNLLSMQSPFLFPLPSNPKEVLQSMRACSAWRGRRKCLLQRERERRTLQLILTEAAASNVLKRLSLPLPHFLSLPLAKLILCAFPSIARRCTSLLCTTTSHSLASPPLPTCFLSSSPSLIIIIISLSLFNQKNQPQPTRPDLFPSHFSLVLLSLSLSSLLSSFHVSSFSHSPSLHLSPPPLVSVNVTIDPHFHSSLFSSFLSFSFFFLSFSPNFFPLLQTSSLPKTHPTIILFSISILIISFHWSLSSNLNLSLTLSLFQSSLTGQTFSSFSPSLHHSLSYYISIYTYINIFAEAEHGYASTFIPASHDDDLMQTKRGGRIHHNSTSSSIGSGSGININNNKDKQQKGGSKLNKKSQGNRYIILSFSLYFSFFLSVSLFHSSFFHPYIFVFIF